MEAPKEYWLIKSKHLLYAKLVTPETESAPQLNSPWLAEVVTKVIEKFAYDNLKKEFNERSKVQVTEMIITPPTKEMLDYVFDEETLRKILDSKIPAYESGLSVDDAIEVVRKGFEHGVVYGAQHVVNELQKSITAKNEA